MRTIFIDSNFKCHVSNDGTMLSVKTSVFEDKCDAFIEGYRFVPAGESWTREDGTVFYGEMVTPWKPYSELDTAQRTFEKEQLAEAKTAIEIILGEAS